MSEFDLPKEEYLTLRKEIETHMIELGQLERNCVLAAAGVYAWLVKDGINSPIAAIGWYIPVLFAVFGGMRSVSLGLHLISLGKYIMQIESTHFVDKSKPQGWEHHLASTKSPIRRISSVAFWIVFLLTTVAVGVLSN